MRVVPILILAATVSACSGGDSPESKFINTVRGSEEYGSEVKVLSDKELLDIPQGVCRVMEEGGGGQAILERVASSVIPAEAYGYVTARGVEQFCPEHKKALKEMFSGSS